MKIIDACLSNIPLKIPMILGGLCFFNIAVIVFSVLLKVFQYSRLDELIMLSLVCLNGALNICFTLYFAWKISREHNRQLADVRTKLEIFTAKAKPGPESRPLKALIVEDQALNREMIGRILTSFGMEPYFAKDGVECIEAMEEHDDLDLILLDLRMPRMDGWTVAQKIRGGEAGEKFSEIPIAVVSGEIDSEECFREMGVNDFIHKPFEASEIRSFVNKVGVEQIALAG